MRSLLDGACASIADSDAVSDCAMSRDTVYSPELPTLRSLSMSSCRCAGDFATPVDDALATVGLLRNLVLPQPHPYLCQQLQPASTSSLWFPSGLCGLTPMGQLLIGVDILENSTRFMHSCSIMRRREHLWLRSTFRSGGAEPIGRLCGGRYFRLLSRRFRCVVAELVTTGDSLR